MGASELLPSQIKGTSFPLKAKRAEGHRPKMCGWELMNLERIDESFTQVKLSALDSLGYIF